jgi:hypothetical protein
MKQRHLGSHGRAVRQTDRTENHCNPGTTSLLPAAILGAVTSIRTRTTGRDVPRESREKQ